MKEYEIGITQSQTFDLAPQQAWEQHPFMMMQNIEVLDNLRERGRGFEPRYIQVRDEGIKQAPIEKPTYVFWKARSGAGKGVAASEFYDTLRHDESLSEWVEERDVELDIVPVPFSMYAQAAKLDSVRRERPHEAVHFDIAHGAYRNIHYRHITSLAQTDMYRYLLLAPAQEIPPDEDVEITHAIHRKKRKVVYVVEESSTTSVPITFKPPVVTRGPDRANSIAYNKALDPETKDQTYIFAIAKNASVGKDSIVLRSQALAGETETVVHSPTRLTFTGESGDEVSVASLPEEMQRAFVAFYSRNVAPPAGIERSDAENKALKRMLGVSSDAELFKVIRSQLKTNKLFILSNPHFDGSKTQSLDFYINSLPARLYPQLVPKEVWEARKAA